MKKVLMAMAFLAVSTFTMSAATVTCTIGTGNSPTFDSTSTCAAYNAAPGFFITSYDVYVITGFTGNATNEPLTVNIDYTIGAQTGSRQATGTLSAGGSDPYAFLFTVALPAGTTSLGPVAISLDGSIVTDGGTVPFVGAISGQIELRTNETSTIPEPSTYAMLGSALVGLGLLRRRKA